MHTRIHLGKIASSQNRTPSRYHDTSRMPREGQQMPLPSPERNPSPATPALVAVYPSATKSTFSFDIPAGASKSTRVSQTSGSGPESRIKQPHQHRSACKPSTPARCDISRQLATTSVLFKEGNHPPAITPCSNQYLRQRTYRHGERGRQVSPARLLQ